MVATLDVGHEVANLLLGAPWDGRRVSEMGSRRTPNEVAAGMSEALGREVVARPIPRVLDATIAAMGVPPDRAGNWAEMEDGFNSGWIDFGVAGTEAVAATTAIAQVYCLSG